MTSDKSAVRRVLAQARAAGREALTAPEARGICEAYGINIPREGVARTGEEAVQLATDIGFPVVMKIVSPQILHKTEAGGVLVGVRSTDQVAQGFATIVENARKFDPKAEILGVQIQQMLAGGHEVIIGAVTDPAFGKLVAFGLGGVLVEVLKDITFRLAPATAAEALSMLDGIRAAEILRGVRGAKPADREALGSMIQRVSTLVADFPEIAELDLNPVFATETDATAADVRVVLNFNPPPARYRPDRKLIVEQMNRIMRPDAVAVIGASAENGKIGNSVITGGEPPTTYQNTVRLGLEDPRIHALILGYWHTIITPPMVFARLMVEVVDQMRAKGIEKPVVASLAGDVEVEEAAEYLYQHGIPAYAYSTEIPVAVLGAKYKWARGAGLIPT